MCHAGQVPGAPNRIKTAPGTRDKAAAARPGMDGQEDVLVGFGLGGFAFIINL